MSALPVLVFGAGGHGRVVAEVVQASGRAVAGFVDDGVAAGTVVLGLPVLGDARWLAAQPPGLVALGVGHNATREQVSAQLQAAGHALGTFVHPAAWVSPSAELAEGVVVMARVAVNAQARIGRGVILNTGCVVEHDCVLGDFSHVSPGAMLGGAARVGRRSHVGLGAVLLQLATVGDDCVVGGGAVVLRQVPDGDTVVGVPARRLSRR